jgi:hypothetical protein
MAKENIEDKAGVYVVLCEKEKECSILDVGESSKVKKRLRNHERESCWIQNCGGKITHSIHYTPRLQQKGRMAIEKKIRETFKPPCGKT